MLNTKLRRTSLILLAVVLMLSVFSMSVFAEETAAEDVLITAAPADGVEVDISVDTDVAETEAAADAETDAAADAEAEEKADETVEETADEVPTTGADDGHDHSDETTGEEEQSGLGTSDIVSLIILGIVVIVTAVYCIAKREKVGKFFRSLKSEFKKIVWSPRDQVRKNTIVVVVVVVALAVIIALADLVFMKGITALSVLF